MDLHVTRKGGGWEGYASYCSELFFTQLNTFTCICIINLFASMEYVISYDLFYCVLFVLVYI